MSVYLPYLANTNVCDFYMFYRHKKESRYFRDFGGWGGRNRKRIVGSYGHDIFNLAKIHNSKFLKIVKNYIVHVEYR